MVSLSSFKRRSLFSVPLLSLPRYLLLDEPTASLDLAHQHLTLRIARKFARENTGVLIVLHDLNLAAAYADRICLMKNGRMTESGTPTAILTAANIKTIFDFDVLILEHDGLPLVVPQTAEKTKAAGIGRINSV